MVFDFGNRAKQRGRYRIGTVCAVKKPSQTGRKGYTDMLELKDLNPDNPVAAVAPPAVGDHLVPESYRAVFQYGRSRQLALTLSVIFLTVTACSPSSNSPQDVSSRQAQPTAQRQPPIPSATPSTNRIPTRLTYESKKPPHYTIQYPTSYQLKSYGDNDTSIDGPFITLQGPITITIDIHSGDLSGTFEQWAQEQARLTCDCDGPNGGTTCPSVAKVLPFKSHRGAEGYEIYVNLKTTDANGRLISTVAQGPLFIFDVSAADHQHRLGLIIQAHPASLTPANQKLLRSIVETLAF